MIALPSDVTDVLVYITVLCDDHTMTQSPTDGFLRLYCSWYVMHSYISIAIYVFNKDSPVAAISHTLAST